MRLRNLCLEIRVWRVDEVSDNDEVVVVSDVAIDDVTSVVGFVLSCCRDDY